MFTISSIARLVFLAVASISVLTVPSSVLATPPMSHRSIWGLIGPTTQTRTVELHVELWCGPGQLYDYCTISVTIPAGSYACDICGILRNAINSDPCCITKCFSADCDPNTGELVVSNCRMVCGGSGGFVCFDPAGLGALRLVTDVGAIGIPMPYYLSFYDPAGGVALDANIDPGVLAIYTGIYPDGSTSATQVFVPTYPGMTGTAIAEEIAAAFRSAGVNEAAADGYRVRLEPVTAVSVPHPGLQLRASGPDAGGAWLIDAWARRCDDAFAFAEARFDVRVEGGEWLDTQLMLPNSYGDAGERTGAGVTGIVVGQLNPLPDMGPSRDTSQEVLLWRGRWFPPGAGCWTPSTRTTSFNVYDAEPGSAPITCGTGDEASTRFATGDAACEPAAAGAFNFTVKVNDTALGYAMSAAPNLLCALNGTRCADACMPVLADDFESGTLGPVCGTGGWEPWLGGSGAICGQVVADRPGGASGARALKITGTPGPINDTVHRIADASGGRWVLSVQTFVPQDATGQSSIVLLNTYDDPPGAPIVDADYSLQIRLDADGGQVLADFNAGSIPLIKGRWVSFRADIDLDHDTVDYFYGGVRFAAGRSWRNAFGTGGLPRIEAIDLYGAGLGGTPTTGTYYDDIVVRPVSCNHGCPADFNGDGQVNSQDFFDFLTAFFATAPGADFNHDGTINSQDFFDFLTAFFAGC